VKAATEASHVSELPVVVLLHGVYGSHWSWARSGRAHETLRRVVSSGEVGECILAMPSDGMRGVGSGYLDRPGEDCEGWIVSELPDVVHRVWPDASTASVAIAGLSMGGWGALRLAALHPRRFVAAAGMSPLTHVDQIAGYADPDRRTGYAAPWIDSPWLLDAIVSATGPLPPLRIACGTEDDLITPVRALHEGLVDQGIDHEYADGPGGHTWDYWAQDLADVLRFFDRSFRAA
jgi:S-formylglutathione hydrolase FrmB